MRDKGGILRGQKKGGWFSGITYLRSSPMLPLALLQDVLRLFLLRDVETDAEHMVLAGEPDN